MKTLAVVFAVVFLLVPLALAQKPGTELTTMGAAAPAGDASSAPATGNPAITLRPATAAPHHFLDLKNAFAASALAAGIAGDSWSTERALENPGVREANPLARPFVSSRTGEAVYSGSSLGLVLAGMYLAHKTHHHKLERVAPWVLAGWEGFLTGWNLHQASRIR